MLEQCRDDAGNDPYRWVEAAVDAQRAVLDLACGSAPLTDRHNTWIGLDASSAELGAAAARGASPLVAGDATALPFAAASFDAVVCSMALMVTQPLERVLQEITRVLRPGGQLVALLPTTRPLGLADYLRYARLLMTLRHTGLGYPNDDALTDIAHTLERGGLTLIQDDRRRFTYPVATPDAARQLVASLYLPRVDAARVTAAERATSRWVGHTLGVPLRRIVARRSDPQSPSS